MNRFLFFKWKKEWFINILIILEITLWILMIGQLISLLTFDKNYIDKFKKSFPVNSGISVFKFDNPINNNVFLKLRKDYKDKYIVSKKIQVSKDDILIKEGLERDFIKNGLERYEDSYNLLNVNYNYIKFLMDNLDGKVTEDIWKGNEKITPVILGKNFKKLYSIGDIIEGKNNKKYNVIGILNKDLIFSNSSQDPIANSESLNDTIISPGESIYADELYSLIISGDSLDESREIYNELYKIDQEIKGNQVNDRLVETLEMINSRKLINIGQSISATALAVFIIALTIKYKIDENKEKIGIIMTYGGSSKYIAKVFFKEIFILVFISTIISIPITFKLTKLSFFFFYNANQKLTISLSLIITLAIILIVIALELMKIRKLTLKDLIGGVRE